MATQGLAALVTKLKKGAASVSVTVKQGATLGPALLTIRTTSNTSPGWTQAGMDLVNERSTPMPTISNAPISICPRSIRLARRSSVAGAPVIAGSPQLNAALLVVIAWTKVLVVTFHAGPWSQPCGSGPSGITFAAAVLSVAPGTHMPAVTIFHPSDVTLGGKPVSLRSVCPTELELFCTMVWPRESGPSARMPPPSPGGPFRPINGSGSTPPSPAWFNTMVEWVIVDWVELKPR